MTDTKSLEGFAGFELWKARESWKILQSLLDLSQFQSCLELSWQLHNLQVAQCRGGALLGDTPGTSIDMQILDQFIRKSQF